MPTSNMLLTAPQAQLAEKLCRITGMDRVFFGVCGATANETGLKIAKKHGLAKRPDGDYEIICLHKSFHGRTLGALSATGQRRYQRSFEPLVPGFRHIEANNLQELKEAFSHKTAAILIEPIMGEGGILPMTTEFLREAERLCREHDAFLMLDEVQCGMGRTGSWFCFQTSFCWRRGSAVDSRLGLVWQAEKRLAFLSQETTVVRLAGRRSRQRRLLR